jgi:CheY-like chemotaxis protein/anti-sigma regulatory factor (Ser/Thr protein kinase)
VEGVVMGDRNRIQQIIWNLLSNAIKFTPKGGRVHVTVERVDSHVELAVADSGIGIEPQDIAHVFDRFHQADSSIRRRAGGLGLGLAIVKNLVELHGGVTHAKSAGGGQGTTFVVSLPLLPARQEEHRSKAEARNAAVDEAAPEQNLAGITVLVVDDEPDCSAVLRRILERNGARVTTAGSMDEALASLADSTPNILLSDIGMPDHDGYELIARVRALPAGRKLPAVALTALARAEDRTRALRAGFQMHISKPVEAGELLAAVANLAALQTK